MFFATGIAILINPYPLTGQVILHFGLLIYARGLNAVKLLILLECQEIDHFLYSRRGGFLLVEVPVMRDCGWAFDGVLLGGGGLDVDDLGLLDEIVEIEVELDPVEEGLEH
jgi:hypothetical protein